ncbi:MAG: polyphosphate--glucose phosphotransferase [Brevibacterium yomogidense]|uniref:polyphosphate--glucose phosphotransferase n=1 Tax=Brevibacterium sp. Mu109 TaxID=1255669 RepID=UPI000C53A46E|nr:ROK family protein [Brevibacterium sp. Mu109]SMX69127.1 polyphosphate glucokinase [Brevibacterium sp. Mu109]
MSQRETLTTSRLAIGIDIGGTGTKAGLVDVATGTMLGSRVREDTPQPATPQAVIATVASVVSTLGEQSEEAGLLPTAGHVERLPIGCAFPGVIKQGTVQFTGNLDDAFDGFPIVDALSDALGAKVHMANDADAAGLAEMTYGAGRDHRKDTVMMTTLGTGIGTALFAGGRLFPYTELGHLTVDGVAAETRTSVAAMRRDGYDMQEWCRRLTVYYRELERLFWPDLFIVGGGISKRAADFLSDIDVETPIRAAELLNNAGIVGAGLLGHNKGKMKVRRKVG